MADFAESNASEFELLEFELPEFELPEFDLPEFDFSAFDLDADRVFNPEFFKGYSRRRLKAAIALSFLWILTAVLHFVSWGHEFVLVITAIMAVHALRVIFATPHPAPEPLPSFQSLKAAAPSPAVVQSVDTTNWPYVSLLVAAKNEEGVIGKLVDNLLHLDYPKDRYDLWFIDDYSTDETPEILDELAAKEPRLNVIHRGPDATGGKSGALNLVWPQTKGDLLAVFDADAQVNADLLRHVVPMFDAAQGGQKTGAVQVRKAIANASTNFWTRGQKAEMALDCYMQQRRIAVGGIGELRGNGQFVRRSAIAQCGGWNEETITDDLDLTIQLHLNQWNIGLLFTPSVGEEGVTDAKALWHQRNRWAEGGFQRYLDYWRLLAKNRLGWAKSLDMTGFWIIQYMMPLVAMPDLLLALVRHQMPVYGPITMMAVAMSAIGMFTTLRQAEKMSVWSAAIQTVRGSLYMLHWLVVIGSMSIRIALRQKRLKWVKTVHGTA
ncbi:MAG: glycosyltransferase family 2 protein [Cyanobacteria bacterium J06560_6]